MTNDDLGKLLQEPNRRVLLDDNCVTLANLERFVGRAVFSSERMYEPANVPVNERTSRNVSSKEILAALPHGVVMGLAWTSMGGSVLYIETINVDSDKGGYALTGNVGQVISESMKIAYSYAQYFLRHFKHKYGAGDDSQTPYFFDKNFIHMHSESLSLLLTLKQFQQEQCQRMVRLLE